MGARTDGAYEGTRYRTHGESKTHHRKYALGVVEKLLSLITFFAAAKKVIPRRGGGY
jgi:hypothetical protein